MKRRLRVNEHGFSSIYALCILNVVLAFSLMVIQISTSIAQSYQDQTLIESELFVIYHIKERLSRMQKSAEEQIEVNTSETEIEREEEPIHFPLTQETLFYHGHMALLTYDEEDVIVELEDMKIEIGCDFTTYQIMEFAYLS